MFYSIFHDKNDHSRCYLYFNLLKNGPSLTLSHFLVFKNSYFFPKLNLKKNFKTLKKNLIKNFQIFSISGFFSGTSLTEKLFWPKTGYKLSHLPDKSVFWYYFFKLATNWPKICFWPPTYFSGQHLQKLANLSENGQ